MNKNIKNIIRFCLYGIIALSAINLICAEKIRIESKNSHEDELQPTYYNFLNINTPVKYNNAAYKLINKKHTPNVTIECDMCSEKIIGIFYKAYKNILTHRSHTHRVCKYNNLHETSLCNCNEPFFLSNDERVAIIVADLSLIKLNFAQIDTKEKYDDTLKHLASKDENIVIVCDQKECTAIRTGLLNVALYNMIAHRKKKHLICKCGAKYESIELIKNCKNCKQTNTLDIN